MIPKWTVEFSTQSHRHALSKHYSTDDPVACEQFVEELLEGQYPIRGIAHEGVQVSKQDFDRIIKNAASMLASKHICASLDIKADEERFRFGFAA